MPSLEAYKKHVDHFGHECVMQAAAADPHMTDNDVKQLAKYITQTAKKVIRRDK